jgi:ribosome-binding factor A
MAETVRELIANELERIGDDRLDLVTITSVKVDGDLSRARAYYSALTAESEGRVDEVAEALEDHRRKVQAVVNRAIRARKVPQVEFRPDDVLASALRIEDVIRSIHASDTQSETSEEE